jgi:hypothetical protein
MYDERDFCINMDPKAYTLCNILPDDQAKHDRLPINRGRIIQGLCLEN